MAASCVPSAARSEERRADLAERVRGRFRVQTRRRDPWTGHASDPDAEPPQHSWRETLGDLVLALVAVALITFWIAVVTGMMG